MSTDLGSRRLLVVHAHPDDECIGTGATMAQHVAAGQHVTLVTCTLGEEGEVLRDDLALLAAGHADQLGGWRLAELTAAMSHLGVTDFRLLGGAGRFRDSGMMGVDSNDNPRAFWRAASDPAVLDAAVQALVAVIREVRPQVVVTYDDNGGYGHPDHIMAHRVTMAAVAAAAADDSGDDANVDAVADSGALAPWTVAKVYWTAVPRSLVKQSIDELTAKGIDSPFGVENIDDLPFLVDDSVVTTAVDASDFRDAKLAALAAHQTQITTDSVFFALSNNLGRKVLGVEHYRLVAGSLGPDRDDDGYESDLFAGVGD